MGNRSPIKPVKYDSIAPAYDQRYAANPLNGVARALHDLVKERAAREILEAGCGTGRWLAELQPEARRICGLDLSLGMLQKALEKGTGFDLVCGRAEQLPFQDAAFDLVFCVNAFHHFSQPPQFVFEACRLLRPGGALAIIGMDPHAGRDRYYLYDYFEGTYEVDLERFSSGELILEWMAAAGMDRLERRAVESIAHTFVGRSVLDDLFLRKHSTSQLVLLSDEAYADGLSRMERALSDAEQQGKQLTFPVDITLYMVAGYT